MQLHQSPGVLGLTDIEEWTWRRPLVHRFDPLGPKIVGQVPRHAFATPDPRENKSVG